MFIHFKIYVDGVQVIGNKVGKRVIKYFEIDDEKEIPTTFDTTRDQYKWRLTCKELYAESQKNIW